jgi:hypothetical protein
MPTARSTSFPRNRLRSGIAILFIVGVLFALFDPWKSASKRNS